MSTLLMRLAGPLQSWGSSSKFETRDTGREPTKSGVLGMIAAAFGVRRDDEATLQKLNGLRFGVRADQEGRLRRDFHMVKASKTSYLTNRYYLEDAVFTAGVESEDEDFLREISEALRSPAFPLFLGRRSCPPTLPLDLGIYPGKLEQALAETPWQASEWARRRQEYPALRIVTDAEPDVFSRAVVQDIPLSFSPVGRAYGFRSTEEYRIANPDCPDSGEHDPMRELR